MAKRHVQIDIVAGTSIGAVNAAIIAGSKHGSPEKDLEEFWLEVAESTPTIIPDLFTVDYDENAHTYLPKRTSSASANASALRRSQDVCPKMVTDLVITKSSIGFTS